MVGMASLPPRPKIRRVHPRPGWAWRASTPDCWGRVLASRLMAALLDPSRQLAPFAAEWACKVNTRQSGSHPPVYEKFGFVVEGTAASTYGDGRMGRQPLRGPAAA